MLGRGEYSKMVKPKQPKPEIRLTYLLLNAKGRDPIMPIMIRGDIQPHQMSNMDYILFYTGAEFVEADSGLYKRVEERVKQFHVDKENDFNGQPVRVLTYQRIKNPNLEELAKKGRI